jgi:hypothetical protein
MAQKSSRLQGFIGLFLLSCLLSIPSYLNSFYLLPFTNDSVSKVDDSQDRESFEQPQDAMHYSSYYFHEYYYDGFEDLNLDPWIATYTVHVGQADMGRIITDFTYDPYTGNVETYILMVGDNQKTDIPGTDYDIPEIMDDMSINSGNLIDPDHPWGDGTLKVRFIPNNVKFVYPMPPPIPPSIDTFQYNDFYINYRTSPTDSFLGNNLYHYSSSSNDPQIATISLAGIDINDYFELSMRATLWTTDNWVKIDYVQIDNYEINVTEKKNEIPSNEDQIITLNFLSRGFNLNTNPNSIRVYYNAQNGPVTKNSPYFTASGSTNPFQITIDSNAYIQGYVNYRIYFENTNGHDFITPQMSFYCYDNEAPTIVPPNYDNNPEYQNGLTVTANVADTGGSHLGSAILYYAYDTAPTINPSQSISPQTQPTGDSASIQFNIPTDRLRYGFSFRFQIFVFDQAGNNVSTNILSATIRDLIPPAINIIRNDLHAIPGQPGKWFADLGYDSNITFRVVEPLQASGVNTLYWSIQFDTAPTYYTDGTKTNLTPGQTSYTITIPSTYEVNTHFFLFIYAKDNAGNEYNNPLTVIYDVIVKDERAPDVFEGVDNTRNPDFNQTSLNFIFNAWEPVKANGVNASSITFKYKINNTAWVQLSGTTIIGSGYVNKTYTLGSNIFGGYGTRIDYEYVVKDNNAGNTNTIARTLYVTDRIKPSFSMISALENYSISNYTLMYSFRDASFSMYVLDQIGGAGIKNVTLIWMNGTDTFTLNDSSITYFTPVSNTSEGLFTFILPELYIGSNGLSVLIRAYDNADNYEEWFSNNFTIVGKERPVVIYHSLDYSNDPYLKTRTSLFIFMLDDTAFVGYSITGNRLVDRVLTNNISTYLNFPADGIYTVEVYYNDITWSKQIIIDTVTPAPLAEVHAKLDGKRHIISWSLPAEMNESESVSFLIYRGENESFTIEQGVLVGETDQLSYSYEFDATGTFYYKIVVMDKAKNPSLLSPASNSIIQVESKTTVTIIIVVASVTTAVTLAIVYINKKRKFFGLDQTRPIKENIKEKLAKAGHKMKNTIENGRKKLDLAKKEIQNKKMAHPENVTTQDLVTNSSEPINDNIQKRFSPETEAFMAKKKVPSSQETITEALDSEPKTQDNDDGWS